MLPQRKRENEQVKQLLSIFPNGDPDYFRECLHYYKEDAVERIIEKITENYGSEYPQKITGNKEERQNKILKTLAIDLFPQYDVCCLREQTLSNKNGRIETIIDRILNHPKIPERLEYGKLYPSEQIRHPAYKSQAELQLVKDFPQVWKSSIRAVLAENNWDYLKSFEKLKELGSGGILNMLKNLIFYFSSTSTSTEVTDKTLLTDLDQLYRLKVLEQIDKDKRIADEINLKEYELNDQCITCDCCYLDCAFEKLVFCSEGEHGFCHDCLNRYFTEGLFGQGNLRGKSRIDCITVDGCHGCISISRLKHVLSKDILKAYENALLENYTSMQQNRILQCCACNYFELDESIVPLESTILYRYTMMQYFTRWFQHNLKLAHLRIAKTRRGDLFNCVGCKTITCLDCFHPVRGTHVCWEKETDGLRLYVEKAMADAVKRTCPNCLLSFQKLDGCNKITCKCGYTMCYICRKDIRKESYGHFCNHFREIPGSKCSECKKCDLYKTDPENELIERAAVLAKNQYMQAHPELQSIKTNMTIGPKSTLDKLNEWKQETVIWCLEKCLDFIV